MGKNEKELIALLAREILEIEKQFNSNNKMKVNEVVMDIIEVIDREVE